MAMEEEWSPQPSALSHMYMITVCSSYHDCGVSVEVNTTERSSGYNLSANKISTNSKHSYQQWGAVPTSPVTPALAVAL